MISKLTVNTLYFLSASAIIAGVIFQVTEPLKKKSAKGLSLVMLILTYVAICLRLPYFVLSAKRLGKPVMDIYALPIISLSLMLTIYAIIIGIKIWLDSKEKQDATSGLDGPTHPKLSQSAHCCTLRNQCGTECAEGRCLWLRREGPNQEGMPGSSSERPDV